MFRLLRTRKYLLAILVLLLAVPAGIASATVSAPTGLKLVAGDSQLTASWQGSDGASYQARSRPVGGSWNYDTVGKQTTHVIAGLTNGKTYEVQVRVKSSEYTSSYSAVVTGIPMAGTTTSTTSVTSTMAPDSSPTGLKLVAGDTQLTASWQGPDGASYQARSRPVGGSWNYDTVGKQTTHVIAGLTNGKTYEVQVRVKSSEYTSSYSPIVTGIPTAGTTAATTTTTAPTTSTTVIGPSSRYKKVVNIWMENKNYSSVIGSSSAPFINQMANTYGSATAFHYVSHPSLSNYIAATSGGLQGVTVNDLPSKYQLNVESIFGQMDKAGISWKSYQESMTSNCLKTNSGNYAVKHNPAAYYVPLTESCKRNVVPMGSVSSGPFITDVNNGTLPAFSFVTANMCNSMHDCSVSTGDTWMKSWVTKIMAGPDYKRGDTVIIISWDESGSANYQPEVVISPTTNNIKTAEPLNHYARLRALEDMFGLPYLGKASTASPNYRKAFNLL